MSLKAEDIVTMERGASSRRQRVSRLPSKGCHTCRARRLKCDRALPSCSRCTRGKRACGGYGMALSWPRTNDGRRSMVGPAPNLRVKIGSHKTKGLHWIRATTWDVELHQAMMDSTLYPLGNIMQTTVAYNKLTENSTHQPSDMRLLASLSWIPFHVGDAEMGLIQYYHNVASLAFITFGNSQMELRNVLIRMCFSENTPSSNAILRAVLALSSAHRDGHQKDAIRLKIGALQALRTSMADIDTDKKKAMQHMAAGMVLSTLELHGPAETYNDWIRYGCGVKHVIQAAQLISSENDEDAAVILGWVHYLDVLARFSMRHWQRDDMYNSCYVKASGRVRKLHYQDLETPRPSSTPHKILHLLSVVSETVLDPSDPDYDSKRYKDRLRRLQRRLKNLDPPAQTQDPTTSDMAKITELHRLAILTYLERASGQLSRDSQVVDAWTDQAFRMLKDLGSCRWLFPLLIFGSEARTEKQRRLISEVMDTTEKDPNVRSLRCLRATIEAIWIQDDLADGDLVYLDKMRAVLSSSPELPIFV